MTDPMMSPLERFDLEQRAGYPFISNRKAQEYRMRMVIADMLEQMLTGTAARPERRRTDREKKSR